MAAEHGDPIRSQTETTEVNHKPDRGRWPHIENTHDIGGGFVDPRRPIISDIFPDLGSNLRVDGLRQLVLKSVIRM